MTFDLPIDATINGQEVYHKGNHDDRGNPHAQYVPKRLGYFFETRDTNHNKFVKIATVNYVKNPNVILFYRLKMVDINDGIENYRTVDIVLKYDNSLNVIRNNGNADIKFYGVQTNIVNEEGFTVYNLEIYAKCFKQWRYVFYDVEIASNVEWDTTDNHYLTEYAYRHITLTHGYTFLTSLETNLNEVVKRNVTNKQVTSQSFTIPANSEYRLSLNVTGANSSTAGIAIPSIELPNNILYSVVGTIQDWLIIKMRNFSNADIVIPQIIWNVSYSNIS